jgi:hypothetical protein
LIHINAIGRVKMHTAHSLFGLAGVIVNLFNRLVSLLGLGVRFVRTLFFAKARNK